MNKKILIFMAIIIGAVVFSGCSGKKETENKENTKPENTKNESKVSGPCQEEKVNLPNYGDSGKRLRNCFVEYPGEPSRQDKSYYIIEDICGQFTKEFLENILGKEITKIELPKISSINNCTYYLDDKEYLMLNLEYLSIENQKKGNEFAGYKVEKNSKIPMDNLVAWQEGDLINVVYLVLGPEKFISIRPSSKKTVTSSEFLDFTGKLGEAIKNYK
jgi:hypothetical protein